jgi:aldose 1-epimerase
MVHFSTSCKEGCMIHLRNDLAFCSVDPAKGGLIEKFESGGVPLLYAPTAPTTVGGFAWHGCWPLLPFANRAFGGIILSPDGPIHVPINDQANNNAMHGFGVSAEWEVVEQSETGLHLSHERRAGEDPFRYHADQVITLDHHGALTVGLSVENRAKRILPYGLGLHPWFPCDEDTRFEANASKVVTFDGTYRATGQNAVDEETDWRKPRPLKGKERVANFLDWDSTALLHYPSRGHAIRIEASDSLRFGLLWTPGDTDFVCFEPQSHVIGAPSDPVAATLSPMAWLEQGQSLTGWMRIRLLSAG